MTAPYMKSSRSSHPPHSPHVLDPISNLRSHVRALFEPLPHAPGNGFDAEYNVRSALHFAPVPPRGLSSPISTPMIHSCLR